MSAPTMIDAIREASRSIVRELGFMGGKFAGTELSPSAVHALIEIERDAVTARDLASLLRLEKSSVSRMLRKLIEAGYVTEQAGAEDGRMKLLSLTPLGIAQVSEIHAFARVQVSTALARLQPGQEQAVLEGLSTYSRALKAAESERQTDAIKIVEGYQTGLIAEITRMHARYYARAAGFGRTFEALVAGGLADFVPRLDHPRNAIWLAQRGTQICGSIAIDGHDMGDDIAHLRWFILDDGVRGAGLGRKLLCAALAFVDTQQFRETQLTTISGLPAARHLYETHGFTLVEEREGSSWGAKAIEQRFIRPAPRRE